MKITCKHCKNTVDVPMYFYDHRIHTATDFMTMAKEYTSLVRGKAICLCCGSEIDEMFLSVISKKDIERLAIGREINQ